MRARTKAAGILLTIGVVATALPVLEAAGQSGPSGAVTVAPGSSIGGGRGAVEVRTPPVVRVGLPAPISVAHPTTVAAGGVSWQCFKSSCNGDSGTVVPAARLRFTVLQIDGIAVDAAQLAWCNDPRGPAPVAGVAPPGDAPRTAAPVRKTAPVTPPRP